MKYIAFLRAINVGGHIVKMERLRELFTELGLNNVQTYIQSGNVFFETDEADRDALTQKIENHLKQVLGYEVATFLRTVPELQHTLEVAPFKTIEITSQTRHYIMFISEPLPTDFKLPYTSPKNDFELLSATAGEVFVLLHLINDRPGNPTAFLEKTFKFKATGRFYHTTIKILDAAKAA